MLWTDADFISLNDLLAIDPDISDTATSLGINLASAPGQPGMIRIGIIDAGRKLENALISFTTYISSNDLSANHLAAVFYTGTQPNQRRRITPDQVVVSGRNVNYDSDIKQWALNRVLIRFYLAASNRSEDDRYTKRLDQFTKRDKLEYWPMLKGSGIPFVYRPMPAPGAIQLPNAGSWSVSQSVQAGCVATGSFVVGITYTDSTRYFGAAGNLPGANPANQNGEGDAGVLKTITLTGGNAINFDITKLNPPIGTISVSDIARGFVVPLNADGWNIYVGAGDGTATVPMYLQNTGGPIPIGTKTYALPADPLTSGFTMGVGQYVDSFMATQDLLQRG